VHIRGPAPGEVNWCTYLGQGSGESQSVGHVVPGRTACPANSHTYSTEFDPMNEMSSSTWVKASAVTVSAAP
jgi:hypothetical protein